MPSLRKFRNSCSASCATFFRMELHSVDVVVLENSREFRPMRARRDLMVAAVLDLCSVRMCEIEMGVAWDAVEQS